MQPHRAPASRGVEAAIVRPEAQHAHEQQPECQSDDDTENERGHVSNIRFGAARGVVPTDATSSSECHLAG